MNSLHIIRTISFPIFLCLTLFSCDKDDDDPGAAPSAERTEYFNVQALDQTFTGSSVSGTQSQQSGSTHFDVSANLGGGGEAQLERSGSLTQGTTYTINSNSTDIGFAFTSGNQAYFCTDCQVQVITHDETDDYLKGRVTGTVKYLNSSFELVSAPFENAEFAVFY